MSLKEDPAVVFCESMLFGPSAIEAQERRGQNRLAGTHVLPSDMRGDTRKILESYGIKFLGEVEDDPMFLNAELPGGWKKERTNHSMWTKLVDEKGRERAAIFYKAAFYDRSAHITLTRRFHIDYDYAREDKDKVAVTHVLDCGEIVFSTNQVQISPEDRWDIQKSQDTEARDWLNEMYPDWENPGAYWDNSSEGLE